MKTKRRYALIAVGLACCFSAGIVLGDTLAQKREALYAKFGPKLIEAIVLVMRDEINTLRIEAGL